MVIAMMVVVLLMGIVSGLAIIVLSLFSYARNANGDRLC
jgi:type II secretory pathway pseudopilin PulG